MINYLIICIIQRSLWGNESKNLLLLPKITAAGAGVYPSKDWRRRIKDPPFYCYICMMKRFESINIVMKKKLNNKKTYRVNKKWK